MEETWKDSWPSDLLEKLQSVSLVSQEENLSSKGSSSNHEVDVLASWKASQTLWATGKLSEPIPNGFYSVIPERRLKELYDTIPSPDELYTLDLEGLRADIILVDAEKDKKLSMLKQLIVSLAKGLNSNPAAVIKKIAGLVCDFYKRPNSELSPAKAALEEISHASECRGVQMLGQLRHGSCRRRAILFKVLADTVGLDCKLLVGLPRDGLIERTDSHKHMSVIVILNSMELTVDLMCSPGELVPCSTKAIFMSHISYAGESDFAEYESCDSPLEPNSPLCGFSERVDVEGAEHDESIQSFYQRKLEAPVVNGSGPSLCPKTVVEGKLGSSRSEPYIANALWRRSRKKVITEQQTSNSSLDHPLFRSPGRSMLSGDKHSFKEYTNDIIAPRSVGSSRSETRRRRRRSISEVPEIGDDIVRAVRAMNETLKRNHMWREQVDASVCSTSDKNNIPYPQENVNFHRDDHDDIPGEKSTSYNLRKSHYSSQRAISLPSSPHRTQVTQRNGPADYVGSANMKSMWNKVLESSKIVDKLLLPFQEWNVEFSELTVGTRVGIGFFGEVFRGIWNGTDVAIKVFLEQDLTIENIQDFCNEISILSRLRHPNVILFLGACTKPPHLSMITEYMESGSLYYLIHLSRERKKLSWRRRLKMLCDICRGLMCIHRMKIVHRDLKSANCLVSKHWTVKICDFGLSRILTTRPMKDAASAGTPEWMAPELIRNEPFTEKCDIFSLGVIMWELCTLNKPWEGVPTVQVVYAVANDGSRLEIPEGPLGKLIEDCWAEPDERPSCEEILSRLLNCEYALC